MKDNRYLSLSRYYEQCFERHGDNHRGVDWPSASDADKRYEVMLGVIRPPSGETSLLDFGCGASHLYEYIRRTKRAGIRYAGLDVSAKYVEFCRKKFPDVRYHCLDVLSAERLPEEFDYIVANGVFTEKRELSFDDMFEFFRETVTRLYASCRKGIAFNVMAKHVDWERDDLFHLSLDRLASFLCAQLGRHFVIRNDYGLYEYTVYVYREPAF